jgi:hypothetical protein|tara:strand:+ start:5397 stop:5990 length:594 start_codon:yes stop_codon:yes gene_type:complete
MPMLFAKPTESFKKINQEVYKRDVQRNDDNRELSETVETSDQVDLLLNSLQEVEGFSIDFANKLSNAQVVVFQAEVPPIGKFLTAIANAEKESLVLDINSVSRNSIDSLVAKRDKLEEILESISIQVGSPEWSRITTQVREALTNLIGNLRIKLVNYKQTVPIEGMSVEDVVAPTIQPLVGTGRFISLSGYQPRRYV